MTGSKRDPADHLPLTDLSFHILLALGDGASHGYAIGKAVDAVAVEAGVPLVRATGSLYQVLRRLHNDGLIAEADKPKKGAAEDSRRQYFRLTPFGKRVFAREAQRLEQLLAVARAKKLLPRRS